MTTAPVSRGEIALAGEGSHGPAMVKLWGDRTLAYGIVTLAFALNFVTGYAGAYAMMGLTLIAIIWAAAWRDRIWRLRQRPAAVLFLAAYLLLVLAFAITAKQPADLKGAINFLYLPFFIPLCGFFEGVSGRKGLDIVALTALAGAVIATGLSLWQVFHLGLVRAAGWHSDPIWSSDAAMITGFLALLGWYAPTRLLPRPVYLLGPVLGTVTTFLTGSRGPLMVIPALTLLLLVVGSRRLRLTVLAALVFAIVVGLPIYLVWPDGAARLNSIAANARDLMVNGEALDGSIRARLVFWHIGWQAFLHAPLAGYGWEHFLAAAYAYLPDQGEAFSAGLYGLENNRHLHADILDIGVSAGLIGLMAYGLLLAAPLAGALKSPCDSQRQGRIVGAMILLVGYFGCGLSYLLFGFEFLTTLYVVIAASLVGFCRDHPPSITGATPPAANEDQGAVRSS